MKTHRILPVLAAAAISAGPVTAQQSGKSSTASLNTLLQKGLLEEEGNQNLEAASAAYRELAEAFESERRLAATAIYRLAEIARKQNHRDEAVKLYQRITAEFSTCEPMARMSRENLAALGTNAPSAPAAAASAVAAASTDELAELRATMKQSPDLINSPDTAGLCPVHRAARDGRTATVEFLLANKVPVDTLSRGGRTALHFAAEAGHKAVAEILVAKGAKLDARFTATTLAKKEQSGTYNGNTQWRTVEEGRHVDDATPLHLALMNRRAALGEWLISKGANVNAVLKMARVTNDYFNDDARRSTHTPLSLAAEANLFEIVDLLLGKGADPSVNLSDEYGNVIGNLLHMAARAGNITLMDKLLARGMPVNVSDGKERIPLYYARDLATLRHLLDKGAAVPADALFHIALPAQGSARREASELLVSKGADVKALNREGRSLLTSPYLAVEDPGFVNWLLDQGVAAETGEASAISIHGGEAVKVIYERTALPKMLKEPAITVTLSGSASK